MMNECSRFSLLSIFLSACVSVKRWLEIKTFASAMLFFFLKLDTLFGKLKGTVSREKFSN